MTLLHPTTTATRGQISLAQLNVVDVSLKRGERWLAVGVSFQARPGELIDLRGANGTGKTTLLRALAGLTPKAEGSVTISQPDGAPIEQAGDAVHFLGHADGVKRNQAALGQLLFWAQFWDAPRAQAAVALAAVGLAGLEELPARSLSAGQRKRLALARLLLAFRPIWLLDEPTSALDTEGREVLGAMMRTHLDAGGLIVAASHEPLPLKPTRTIRFIAEPASGPAPDAEAMP
jgi:heme exporter protein A